MILSYTSLYRFKIETVVTIASKIKESWVPPPRGVVHWDGKLMDTLSNENCSEERLPILFSGVGGVKLLGIPAIPHKSSEKTGPQIGKATKEHLAAWGCAENTNGMVFDTTSFNTGAINAGCISVKQELCKPPWYWLWKTSASPSTGC